jgi:hypothetical protein
MGKTPNCLIFALLALCSSLSVQSVSGQEKLRIAWSGSSPAHTPIWVVEERNLLKKYGIDPNHGMPALDIHEEVTMFVEAGLTPMQAIQAATINVAKTFAKGRDFGTLEPGKFADIIMVDGNPLKDSWATQNVKLVISAGRVIDHNFHSDYKNPIPSPEPWRNIPRNRGDSPLDPAGLQACNDDGQSDRGQDGSLAQDRHRRKITGNTFRQFDRATRQNSAAGDQEGGNLSGDRSEPARVGRAFSASPSHCDVSPLIRQTTEYYNGAIESN